MIVVFAKISLMWSGMNLGVGSTNTRRFAGILMGLRGGSSRVKRAVSILLAVLVLGLSPWMEAQAGTHAAGNSPSAGATTWTSCAACHNSASNATGIPPDSSVFGTAFVTKYGGAACATAGTCPHQPLTYYATNPANITASMNVVGTPPTYPSGTSDMTVTNQNLAVTNEANLSAYFASLLTPSLTNPGATTLSAGAAYNYQVIASASTADYLVSTTTYSATNLPSGVTIGTTTGTISGNVPSASTPSTYNITLNATNASAAPTTGSVSFTLTVKGTQTIVFGTAPTVLYGGTGTVTATGGGSGNAIVYSTASPGCSVNSSSGVVSGLAAGTSNCVITANQASSATYDAAAPVTQTISIGKANQTISFGTLPTLTYAGAAQSISATATSALAVTYASTTTSVCTVSGNTITPVAAGTCTITADQAGNANYNAAPQASTLSSLVVAKANQTISFGALPTLTYGGSAQSITASSTSLLAVTLASTTPGVCTISGGTITPVLAGTCTITADQAGNANYNAAPQASTLSSLVVAKATPVINIASLPASITVGNTSPALNLSSASTGAISLALQAGSSTYCSLSGSAVGSTVTGIAAGSCVVNISVATDSNYLAAITPATIAVGLNPQTVTFTTPLPTLTYGGASQTIAATASSGLAITTYASTTPGTCTVSGNTITPVAGGTCTITATQSGNGTYSSATASTSITVAKVNQTITFGALPALTFGGATQTIAATATSGLPVTAFGSTTTGTCTVSGSTITPTGAGVCTITADQSGNGNYNAAPQVNTGTSITVGKASQTITFGTLPTLTYGAAAQAITATGTPSGQTVTTFASTTAATCTVSGSSITPVAAGSCTITADLAASANYNAAPTAQVSITVGQASQAINVTSAPTTLPVGTTATLAATATSGSGVTFSSNTPTVCTVSGNSVTAISVGGGTCTISANQAGTANYSGTTLVLPNITVTKGSQTITFGTAPSLAVGGTATVSATGGGSSSPVVFSSTTASICTILLPPSPGNVVSGLLAGTCKIDATQAGDANYAPAAPTTLSITVVNLPPTVAAASMTVQMNATATLDLISSIAGFGVTGVSISARAAHGTVGVSGTKVSYTPNKDYFGSDSFTYKAYAAGGLASVNAAAVTVTVVGRSDPTKDARVTGLINIQTATVKRFGMVQVFNFQQRLESRHQAAYSSSPSASSGPGSTPVPAGGALPGQNRGYFNSWQPGTVLAYENDPDTLLHAPGRLNNGQVATAYDPMVALLMSTVTNAVTNSSLNLGAISNVVGAATNDSFSRLEVWAAGNLRFGTTSQAGVNTQFSTDGVSIGADKRLDRKLTVGMGVGYARDNSSIGTDGTNSTSSGNSVATYASYQTDAGAFLDGLLGYGKVNFNTNRYVDAVNDFARASRTGDQIFGSLSFGYDFRKDTLLWSPYGRYDFAFNRLNEGTESGAGTNALYYAAQNARSSHFAIGMRAQSVHQTTFGVVQPHVRFEFQRAFETSGKTSVSYADLLGVQYAVAATSQNSNAVVLGLGSDFLLSDTLKLALEYQRLRSTGVDSYQSINFRLTKDIDGKNDLANLLEESYASTIGHPSGLVVAAGFAYDDNVSRASEILDKLSDTIYSGTISKAHSFAVSRHTKLTVSGFMDIEKFRNYAGLDHVSGGMQGEYMYRSEGDYGAPTFGIFLRYTGDEFASMLRDGSHGSAGLTLRKPLTDRINLFAAIADNVRRGKSDVFNTKDVSGRMNLDYALSSNETIYLTGEYRKGDIVSSGRPSVQIMDISTVLVQDDVFAGFYDYRMKGTTALFTLGYNVSFGSRDSLDFSWRRVQTTSDKSPTIGSSALRYIVNQLSVSYMMAF